MNYLFLAIAIILEVIGSTFMKISDGFSKWIPTSITIVAYLTSFYFFAVALKTLSLGLSYAIWAGMGIALTAVVSVLVFKEQLDLPAVIGILFILAGVVIMNVCSDALH